MALTVEVIKANPVLAPLTPEQLTAITTLSSNDENHVIGSKIGELHGRYDTDVKEVSGVEKQQGEKSYDYVKRVLGDFKVKATAAPELNGKIAAQEAKIAELEKSIAEGKGNETVMQKLRDAESKLNALNTQYSTEKQDWQKKESDYTNKITAVQVETGFEKATAGLKFKSSYPENIQATLLKVARETVLAKNKPDWVEGVMIFRDEKGDILRNKNNALNPYTAAELLKEQLKDVLDEGQKVTGGGSKNPAPGSSTTIELVDISSAKTQVEADNLIAKYLIQAGELRGTAAFAERQKKIRVESNVSKLPVR